MYAKLKDGRVIDLGNLSLDQFKFNGEAPDAATKGEYTSYIAKAKQELDNQEREAAKAKQQEMIEAGFTDAQIKLLVG